MVDMAREIDFIERDGIFAFDDGNLAARCFTFAIGQLDIARGVDARAAFARGLDFGTVDDDIAFAAVRGQRAAMCTFGRDVDICRLDGAAVGRIEAARGIVFRMDGQMVGRDGTRLARGKDGIGAVSIGGQCQIAQFRIAV